MEIEDAIRVIALHATLKNTNEFWIRNIQRWYSSTFHTPLLQVEDLPFDYLLAHYYEYHYHKMSSEELLKEWQKVVHPEEIQEEQDVQQNNNEADEEYLEELRKDKQKQVLAKEEPVKPLEKLPDDISFQFATDEDMDSEAQSPGQEWGLLKGPPKQSSK